MRLLQLALALALIASVASSSSKKSSGNTKKRRRVGSPERKRNRKALDDEESAVSDQKRAFVFSWHQHVTTVTDDYRYCRDKSYLLN
jgi:hypothetical protein